MSCCHIRVNVGFSHPFGDSVANKDGLNGRLKSLPLDKWTIGRCYSFGMATPYSLFFFDPLTQVSLESTRLGIEFLTDMDFWRVPLSNIQASKRALMRPRLSQYFFVNLQQLDDILIADRWLGHTTPLVIQFGWFGFWMHVQVIKLFDVRKYIRQAYLFKPLFRTSCLVYSSLHLISWSSRWYLCSSFMLFNKTQISSRFRDRAYCLDLCCSFRF